MAILILVAAMVVLVWLLQLGRSRRWRAAERDVAAHLPLGSDRLIPGAQPLSYHSHPRAALLLHGFGDTPQSLASLAERLAEAGWTVSVPLLPGHGRTLAEFSTSTATAWEAAVQRSFDDLRRSHQTVVVCGQSLGAALAISLTRKHPVPALVLLAPYISMPMKARAAAVVWPVMQLFTPIVRTYDRLSIRDREAAERSLAYGYVTPRLLAELWRVVRTARRDVQHLRSATLIVHSREDNRVPMREVTALAARITYPVKALHWVSGCGHVITVDYCKDAVEALVLDWLERCTAAERATTPAR